MPPEGDVALVIPAGVAPAHIPSSPAMDPAARTPSTVITTAFERPTLHGAGSEVSFITFLYWVVAVKGDVNVKVGVLPGVLFQVTPLSVDSSHDMVATAVAPLGPVVVVMAEGTVL